LRFLSPKRRLRVTVVSANGKEATITLLSAGDFIGEDSLAGIAEHRSVTVTAITSSNAMRFTRTEMVRVMHDEQAFSDLFLSHLLARSIRTQRILSISFSTPAKSDCQAPTPNADYGEAGKRQVHSSITQETLAEMVGTTRSRVSFFMNRFRRLGFIDYNVESRYTNRFSRQCSSIACRSMILKRLALGSNRPPVLTTP